MIALVFEEIKLCVAGLFIYRSRCQLSGLGDIKRMNQTTELRELVLLELDKLLFSKGYARLKRTHSWKRKITGEQTFLIHLNVGMNENLETLTIIPSVYIRSEWLTNCQVECGMLDAKYAKDNAHFGKRLTQLKNIPYYFFTVENKSKEIARILFKDIEELGLPLLNEISDYNFVSKLLLSENPQEWVVDSRSSRARYLPLLLILLNRKAEAFKFLELMNKDIEGKDQIIPKFDYFKDWFTNKFEVI